MNSRTYIGHDHFLLYIEPFIHPNQHTMNPKSTILLFVFMCTCTVLAAQQQAQITLRDGTVKQVEIKALSTTTLFTDAGNIEFSDIKQAAFDKVDHNARAIAKLSAAGVPVLVGGNLKEKPAQQPTGTIPAQQRSETPPSYEQVELTLQDATVKQVQVKAFSTTTLFTDVGNIKLADIQRANFRGEDSNAGVIPRLLEAGVGVTIDGQPFEEAKLKAPGLSPGHGPQNVLASSPGLDFEKFRKQRDAGKALQLLGAAALTYSLVASWVNAERTKEAQENNEVPDLIDLSPAIPAIGGAFLTIGILIDVDAGKHLRLRPY